MNEIKDTIIRIGLVGLGYRGQATVRRYRYVPGARITHLCDHHAERILTAQEELRQQGRQAEVADFEKLCQSTDVDLVMICTPWATHAELTIQALRSGKDVALEIPAAQTVEDCNRIRQAAAESGRCVFLLENCCFDPFHLGTLQMVRQGLLGELSHLEGAYIHYLGADAATGYRGNPYPTHGIGPVAQLLGEDKLEMIVSVDGRNSVNSSLLRSRGGVSVLLQYDETTPRPYSRLQTVCATKGFVQKYPQPVVQLGNELWIGAEAEAKALEYVPAAYRALMREGEAAGAENIMNYLMDRQLIAAVRGETTYPITLDEALEWSQIVELSARSATALQSISLP